MLRPRIKPPYILFNLVFFFVEDFCFKNTSPHDEIILSNRYRLGNFLQGMRHMSVHTRNVWFYRTCIWSVVGFINDLIDLPEV